MGAAINNRLIATRALMALDSFRQIILDAQAMMDPDFAGKLSADVAEADAGLGDAGFSFGASAPTEDENREVAEGVEAAAESDFMFGGNADQLPLLDAASFNPFAESPKRPFLNMPETGAPQVSILRPGMDAGSGTDPGKAEDHAFRRPGDPATLPELIRFIIDRTGYIKALETEGTPEAFSRIENLKELANAAHDAEVRGETLADFLDHAALASDTDQYDPSARVTLMTLHSAKGLEFPLVFLAGMEEGLFPHSRTLNNPEGELEEERRLCYVGMTRAMNTLILTRANFRRRYGNDAPEASIPSRFLEEVPPALIENLGSTRAAAWAYAGSYGLRSQAGRRQGDDYESRHYNYEDESQEGAPASSRYANSRRAGANSKPFVAPWMTAKSGSSAGDKSRPKGESTQAAQAPDPKSIDNIARFFGGKAGPITPGSLARPALDIPATTGATGLKKGDRVRHSKYGEGSILMREGDGEDAKLTVMFTRHGMKKLMEKFANLEKI